MIVVFLLGVAVALAGGFLAVVPAGLGVHYYVGVGLVLVGVAVVFAAAVRLDR